MMQHWSDYLDSLHHADEAMRTLSRLHGSRSGGHRSRDGLAVGRESMPCPKGLTVFLQGIERVGVGLSDRPLPWPCEASRPHWLVKASPYSRSG